MESSIAGSPVRIASFLPAATEMLHVLGLGDRLVGRSHECDFPDAVKTVPVLVDCVFDSLTMTPAEIDAAVACQLSQGKSLYAVDEDKLRTAAPDLLVTQNLCQVCGPAGNEVSHVIKSMRDPPRIVWQSPRTFDDVLHSLRVLGKATGTEEKAVAWSEAAKARIERIAGRTRHLKRVRVSFLEWVEPFYCAGHWIPQMLMWAGGEDINGRSGADSVTISWEQVMDFRPEVILVSPCGFRIPGALAQAARLVSQPGWDALPAVVDHRVHALDANAYFARPGPRLVEGVELLAHLLHPEEFGWTGPPEAFAQLNGRACGQADRA